MILSQFHRPLMFTNPYIFINGGGGLRTGFRTKRLIAIFVIHCQQIKIHPNVEVLLYVIVRRTHFHILRDFYPHGTQLWFQT